MPRQLGIQYEGAICHVVARGNRRQATLAQACGRAGWHVQVWVLMA